MYVDVVICSCHDANFVVTGGNGAASDNKVGIMTVLSGEHDDVMA